MKGGYLSPGTLYWVNSASNFLENPSKCFALCEKEQDFNTATFDLMVK